MINELGSFPARQEHIVRSYTGLTGIPEFTHRNPLRDIAQINRWMHQYRRFTAQFQNHRNQIFGSGCHDGFTDCS
ncbi:Uncharacterised protein [Mycobacteroides abscessus subsp. abscessus]|nr:Uncharacterised protein [Mycobacteroides abscessus subsp. abscessus]